MKLLINDKSLYMNKQLFCRVAPRNGRAEMTPGRYDVEVSTRGSVPLVLAVGLGWLGGFADADCILGRVIGPKGVVPCFDTSDALIKLCEAASDLGERITLEIE